MPFVQPFAVEASEVVLPERLPARQHELLELAVRGHQDQGAPGLEPDAAFDPEHRLADVDAAPDAVAVAQRAERATRSGPLLRLAVQCDRNAALPRNDHVLRLRARRRLASQSSGGPAHGSWVQPPPYVVPQIPRLTEYSRRPCGTGKPRCFEEGVAACRVNAASRTGVRIGKLRCQHAKRHVEADLVVSRPGGAVRECRRPVLARYADDRDRLLGALGRRPTAGRPHLEDVAPDQDGAKRSNTSARASIS